MSGVRVTQLTIGSDPAVLVAASGAALEAVSIHDAASDPHPQYAMLGTAIPFVESGAGSAGTATAGSHEDHVHPASGGASFGTPTVTFGTAAAEGTAGATLRIDATLAAFSAAVPVTQAFSDSAAAGTAAFAARIDHRHGMMANPGGGTAGGGALVLLEQHDAAGGVTSLDFTSFISSTYDDYLFRIIGLVPATNGVDFYILFSTSGTFDTGSHYVANHYLQATTGNVAAVTTTTQFITRGAGEICNVAARGLSGQLELFDPQSTTLGKRLGGNIRWSNTTNWVNTMFDGYWDQNTSAVDGVRFKFSSGNIASGTIRVYGIAKS